MTPNSNLNGDPTRDPEAHASCGSDRPSAEDALARSLSPGPSAVPGAVLAAAARVRRRRRAGWIAAAAPVVALAAVVLVRPGATSPSATSPGAIPPGAGQPGVQVRADQRPPSPGPVGPFLPESLAALTLANAGADLDALVLPEPHHPPVVPFTAGDLY